MKSTLKVDCPQCGKQVAWTESEIHRPFCSDRCRAIDLGAWANEEYSIPMSEQDHDWSESHTQDQRNESLRFENLSESKTTIQ